MGVPEVASVGRRTGRAELDEHAEGVHFSEIDVDLKPSARTRDEILADIRARLAVLPASVSVGQPIAHRLDHMLSGIRARDRAEDLRRRPRHLRNLAETLRERLASVPGLADLQVEKQDRIPQLRVEADYERGEALRRDAGRAHRRAGGTVERPDRSRRSSTDGNRRFDVVIRLSDADRSTTGLARPPDRDSVRARPAPSRRRDRGDRRPQPDPARERPAPHRRLRQHRRHARPRRRSSPRSAASLAETHVAAGLSARRSKAPTRRTRKRRAASAFSRSCRSR